MTPPSSVITLVADGARPDVLASAIAGGRLPALARMRDEGSMTTVTTVFPSVTGPAYTPFLIGRHPASVGLPGLRWFDRSRRVCRGPSHSRSYVGPEMRLIDADLDSDAHTMFERVQPSMGALSVIRRGLAGGEVIGSGARFIARTAYTHFRGDLAGWLAIDRDVGDAVVAAVRERTPRYVFAAFTGADKASHSSGAESGATLDALAIVDDVAARIRADAERDGRWRGTTVMVVSDHGHSPVVQHDDLAGAVRDMGYSTLAHPWAFGARADVAVMVSGNAMAHLYVELDARTRLFWPALEQRWSALVAAVCARSSVDLVLLPLSRTECEIRSKRGRARANFQKGLLAYRPISGDPLGIGEIEVADEDDALAATIDSDYPDALVQIARITACSRAGDVILSAAREWDLRARYEPIPHVSSHGALHRDHMLVPLLSSRAFERAPMRTVDVMPSACELLGVGDESAEGRSFFVSSHAEEARSL